MTRERVERKESWHKTLSSSGIVDIIAWQNHWWLGLQAKDESQFKRFRGAAALILIRTARSRLAVAQIRNLDQCLFLAIRLVRQRGEPLG
jgi:hypothetical protein